MQTESNLEQVVKEPRSPSREEVANWEGEGGATPETPLHRKRVSPLRTLRRRARLAVHNLVRFAKNNPGAALGAAFGLGLVVGGGLRRFATGRAVLRFASQPILERVMTTVLARA